MKLLLLCSLLLVVSTTSFSQWADTSSTRAATNYYLKKSKSQKTAAWILLGGGALLTTVGIAVGVAETTEVLLGTFSTEEQSSFSAGAALTFTGLAVMVGSIPLFIAAGKNRRKAMASVSFRMENATNLYQYTVSNTRYPAVAIRIRL
jgi:hypothetical protein